MTDSSVPAPTSFHRFILVAEDDIDDQELLAQALLTVAPPLEATFISNGNKVLKHLETLDDAALPRLFLLDYNIPQVNGAEILKFLSDSERYRHIPKFIWSTSNSLLHKNLCLELGALDYIVKPSDYNSFLKIAGRLASLVS